MIVTDQDAAKWRRQIQEQCDTEGKSALAQLEAYYEAQVIIAQAVHGDEEREGGMLELAARMERRLRAPGEVAFGDIGRALIMLLRHAAEGGEKGGGEA